MLGLLKSKATIWGLVALGGVVFMVWGAMKYDTYRIQTLQNELAGTKSELTSLIKESKFRQEIQTIDESVLREFIDASKNLERSNQTIKDEVAESVRAIREEHESHAEEPDQTTPSKENSYENDRHDVDAAIARRIIDGMYNTYCNTTRDPSRCPE